MLKIASLLISLCCMLCGCSESINAGNAQKAEEYPQLSDAIIGWVKLDIVYQELRLEISEQMSRDYYGGDSLKAYPQIVAYVSEPTTKELYARLLEAKQAVWDYETEHEMPDDKGDYALQMIEQTMNIEDSLKKLQANRPGMTEQECIVRIVSQTPKFSVMKAKREEIEEMKEILAAQDERK